MGNDTKSKVAFGLFLFIAVANLALYWGEFHTVVWIFIALIFGWQNYRSMDLVYKTNALNAELLQLLEHLQEQFIALGNKKQNDDTQTIQRES